MTMIVEINVYRNSDHVEVARITPRHIANLITRNDANAVRKDAKHLSRVYGQSFYVEVWAWWPQLGGDAYHRAYVYVNGRTACIVGF